MVLRLSLPPRQFAHKANYSVFSYGVVFSCADGPHFKYSLLVHRYLGALTFLSFCIQKATIIFVLIFLWTWVLIFLT